VTNGPRGGGGWHWVYIPVYVPGNTPYEMTVEVKRKDENIAQPVQILMLFRGKCEPTPSDELEGSDKLKACKAIEGYVAGYKFSKETLYLLSRQRYEGSIRPQRE